MKELELLQYLKASVKHTSSILSLSKGINLDFMRIFSEDVPVFLLEDLDISKYLQGNVKASNNPAVKGVGFFNITDIKDEFRDLPLASPFKEVVFINRVKGGISNIFYVKETGVYKGSYLSFKFLTEQHKLLEFDFAGKIFDNEFEYKAVLLPFLVAIEEVKRSRSLGLISDYSFREITNSGKAKKCVRRNLYFIGPSKESIRLERSGATVEWQHAWKCCGHWRRLAIDCKTLGKDRNGERNIQGYTWVRECTKGDGDLVSSIRK